jgi:hypothetical protein
MKDILKIKFELLVTPIFIVLFILSVIYVGFDTIFNIIFNVIVFSSIPCVYKGIKTCRKLVYEVFYEDK